MNKLFEGQNDVRTDEDTQETDEWCQSLQSVIDTSGKQRAEFLLHALQKHAEQVGLSDDGIRYSAYRNSIALEQQPPYPGDITIESRLTGIMRWNALCMVARANQAHPELGGHIATYASAAEIFETGFNHFFKGPDAPGGGDLVFFQPHSSPGIYARAFVEGRFGDETLERYRQETEGGGLSSYPHPWLMPDFWQFPTGSMGIGAINAIYQARFMRYLDARGFANMKERHVWGIFGDGEMDEPESIAGLSLAARERLGNLTFIVNCNLQRLDGPVRGNGQVIQELESLFKGAGWRVIKVLWGSDWDSLFAADRSHALLRHFAGMVDGQYQTLGANDGAYNQKHFFALDPELQRLVAHMSAEEIDGLRRGGHDYKKLYAAFAASLQDPHQPTVILAKTKKGYGMGASGESRMTSHQQKKLDVQSLLNFRDRFDLPLTDAQAESFEFFSPSATSPEGQYLRERRATLGGALPSRRVRSTSVSPPDLNDYGQFALAADDHASSTTSVFVRQLSKLLKDDVIGSRIVPIVADEARTFGMASLFRQIGIYSPDGQKYDPEDGKSLLSYRESHTGQLLEEGITEAGALSSWVAAATAYSTHDEPLLPFYIFYSIFGFQRVGDLIWAAADQRARGFLIGATAGRTTLSGEGLQHQDGSSHVMAATVPNCRAYDPAFGYEVAVLVDYGARRMLEEQRDEFYYLTVSNESIPQPSLPEHVSPDNIIRGLYCYQSDGPADDVDIRILASGPIIVEALAAAHWLREQLGINVGVFSMTSASELARDAAASERADRIAPGNGSRESYLQQTLPGDAPIVAATDYVRAVVQPLSNYLDCRFIVLGTDGFGRSDTRRKMRRFFEIDRDNIVAGALQALSGRVGLTPAKTKQLLSQLDLSTVDALPWQL